LSGKPGNVREFDSCQGNVGDFTKSQGKIFVRGKLPKTDSLLNIKCMVSDHALLHSYPHH